MCPVRRQREFKVQPGTGRGVALQLSTQRLDSFAHTPESIPFGLEAPATIILDFEHAVTLIGGQFQPAMVRVSVTNNIGYSFASYQRQHALLSRTQSDLVRFRLQGDSGASERRPGTLYFFAQFVGAVPAQCAANFRH